jgi:hypothetical protein
MITRLTRYHFTIAILSLAWGTLHGQAAWDGADRDTRRLTPSMFRGLPGLVRTDLERRGCTVPQVWYDTVPGNVISGHFRTAAQTDWAVLCSVNSVSSILVYWRGRADSVAEVGSAADKGYLQGVGGGRIGFSRAIAAVDARFIRRNYQEFGGPTPPPLDHDGINDAFVEKASGVWYWHEGKWLRLTGVD